MAVEGEVTREEEEYCNLAVHYYNKGQEVLKKAKTDRSIWYSIWRQFTSLRLNSCRRDLLYQGGACQRCVYCVRLFLLRSELYMHVFQVWLTIKISINILSQLVHTTRTHFIMYSNSQSITMHLLYYIHCNNYLF